MTWVSSESNRSWTTVVPSHSAESNSTRFEMLLEPGRVTVPEAPCSGGRSRKAVENMGQSSEAVSQALPACSVQAERTSLAC